MMIMLLSMAAALTASSGTFWLQAKAKLVQTVQQRNALEQDVQELQQKYAQKAR
jgi:hypothetical protein